MLTIHKLPKLWITYELSKMLTIIINVENSQHTIEYSDTEITYKEDEPCK